MVLQKMFYILLLCSLVALSSVEGSIEFCDENRKISTLSANATAAYHDDKALAYQTKIDALETTVFQLGRYVLNMFDNGCTSLDCPCITEESPCGFGTCTADENNLKQCVCPTGVTGAECDVDIDGCDTGDCLNGGSCSDMPFDTLVNGDPRGHICDCLDGYVGDDCEFPACATAPCQNGATCYDRSADMDPNYDCVCPYGYAGVNCELAACITNPCLNGATCVDNDYNSLMPYTCVCEEGWGGDRCEVSTTCEQCTCTCSDFDLNSDLSINGDDLLDILAGGLHSAAETMCWKTCEGALVTDIIAVSDYSSTMGITANLVTDNAGTGGVGDSYQLYATHMDSNDAFLIYGVYGDDGWPLTLPAAFQSSAPFGADYGGVSSSFFAIDPTCQYDSWLALGSGDASLTGSYAVLNNMDFSSWTSAGGISVTNGGLVAFSGAEGSGTDILVAQVTLPIAGSSASGFMTLRGEYLNEPFFAKVSYNIN